MNRTEFILRQIAKTNKKSYENYVVTRVWNLLNDMNIKMVTQQHITRPSGRALTDLYFPQINLHVEILEGHHFENGEQLERDFVREADIINATGHEIFEIKVVDKYYYDLDISIINEEIDKLVKKIQSEFKSKKPPAWDIESEYNPQTYINKGYISASEGVAFRTIADACNCFGHSYRGFQHATAIHPFENKTLWFPKLYPNEGWDNKISLDENEITMKKINGNREYFEEHINNEEQTIEKLVFPKVRSNLGDVMYRFKGVYMTDIDESRKRGYFVFRRTNLSAKTYKPQKAK